MLQTASESRNESIGICDYLMFAFIAVLLYDTFALVNPHLKKWTYLCQRACQTAGVTRVWAALDSVWGAGKHPKQRKMPENRADSQPSAARWLARFFTQLRLSPLESCQDGFRHHWDLVFFFGRKKGVLIFPRKLNTKSEAYFFRLSCKSNKPSCVYCSLCEKAQSHRFIKKLMVHLSESFHCQVGKAPFRFLFDAYQYKSL